MKKDEALWALLAAAALVAAVRAEVGAPNRDGLRVVSPVRPGPLVSRDGADEVVWSEDFENGLDQWTTADQSVIAWHRSDFNAREDQGLAWWCGDTLEQYENSPVGYDNQWLQYLDSPVLDLSEAGRDLVLTFDAWWLLEDPRLHPPAAPYDGWDGFLVMISTDGGRSFAPIRPQSPEYTADHLSAAGRFWNVGDWPGWVFFSTDGDWPDTTAFQRPDPEWLECTFNLTDYRRNGVVIRWVLISDRAVAAPYGNVYLQESGVLVDNILVTDGETVFLSNNADDDPVPEELTARIDPRFGGDHWDLTDADRHSGNWSLWNDDGFRRSSNTIDSPPIEIPDAANVYFQFWVHCDLPDYDSDGNNVLDDFYQVYVSADGGDSWTYLLHDYARAEAGANDWVHYVPGTHWNPDNDQSLLEYAGQEVQLRWWFWTDADDGGGNGSGLFIDDIEVVADTRLNRDAGMEDLTLPYPLTVGHRLRGFTVNCINYGIQDLAQVTGRWVWKNDFAWRSIPTSRVNIGSGQFVQIQLTDYLVRNDPGWTPVHPGVFDVGVRTTIGLATPADPSDDDNNFDNDSVGVSAVRIWPSGLYELGYDNRTVRVAFPFDQGAGPAARFTPNVIDGRYSLAWAHFQFNGLASPASFRLHVLGSGGADTPGQELLALDVEIPPDSSYPNYMTAPLYAREELRGLEGDFWIWAEVTAADRRPAVTGDRQIAGAGRFFSFDGRRATPLDGDLMIHAAVVPGDQATPEVEPWTRELDFGDVPLRQWRTQTFFLYGAGLEPVTVTDVRATRREFSVSWPGEVTLAAGKAVSFEISFEPTAAGVITDTLVIQSNDQTPPLVRLLGGGVLAAPSDEGTLPATFGLQSVHPNPFNSRTEAVFTLDRPGRVELALYDLSGRYAARVLSGPLPAGTHRATVGAGDLPSGIYVLRLENSGRVEAAKVILLK